MSKTFHLASLPPGTSTCGKVYSLGTLLSFPVSWPVNSLSIKGHSASLYGVVRSCTVVHKAPNAQLPPALFSSLMVSSCGCRLLHPASLASLLFLEYVDSVLPWGLCSKALPSESGTANSLISYLPLFKCHHLSDHTMENCSPSAVTLRSSSTFPFFCRTSSF